MTCRQFVLGVAGFQGGAAFVLFLTGANPAASFDLGLCVLNLFLLSRMRGADNQFPFGG